MLNESDTLEGYSIRLVAENKISGAATAFLQNRMNLPNLYRVSQN